MLENYANNPQSLKTATRAFASICGLRVTVSTTGLFGGDAGHGGRTAIVIDEFDGDALETPYPHDPETLVKIVLGGDDELLVIIPALRFAADALELLSADDHLLAEPEPDEPDDVVPF